MDSKAPYRIDPPSPAISGPVRQCQHAGRVLFASAAVEKTQSPMGPSPAESLGPETDRDAWLGLQSTDLIRRLQHWSDELGAREAQLNVRASLQDNRERQFRLQQQDAAASLAEQQRSIERLRAELESQARRLAFRDN